MNRLEFLTQLRYTLEKGGLPQNDIEDALTYYEEIFLDAGYGKDEETVASLGSPEEIARGILQESGIHADGDAEFVPEKSEGNAEQGSANSYSYGNGNYGETSSSESANGYSYGSYDSNNAGGTQSGGMSTGAKLLLIILTFPLWIGVVATLFGLAVAGIAIAFSLLIAIVAAGFGLTVGGIFALFEVPPIGFCLLGAGLIFCGIFGLVSRPYFKGINKYVFGGIRKLVSKAHDLISR